MPFGHPLAIPERFRVRFRPYAGPHDRRFAETSRQSATAWNAFGLSPVGGNVQPVGKVHSAGNRALQGLMETTVARLLAKFGRVKQNSIGRANAIMRRGS